MRWGPEPLALVCGYWSTTWNLLMLRGQHVKTTVLEPAPSFHRSVQLRHKGLHCPGHVNCLVPELEQEPNSPKLVFFPLSTASSSSLMCFYYKIKVCQSQAFCRFFSPEVNFTHYCSRCPWHSVLSSLLYILRVYSLESPYFVFIIFLLCHINQLFHFLPSFLTPASIWFFRFLLLMSKRLS